MTIGLWDKLVFAMHGDRRFTQKHEDILRANKLAAAIAFCCQGQLFMLSGEDFARTKLGVRNTYQSPLRINRLDWKRRVRFRALAEYYRGLIALRKQLPALCDKRETAQHRLLEESEIAPGAAAVLLDNGGGKSPYAQLMILVNTRTDECTAHLPGDGWAVLCDGESSMLWKKPKPAPQACVLAPLTLTLLGKMR